MKELDHRTRITKMLIQKAFTSLLYQKPIQSISIKELCETAGINRGTFYNNYKDVYDLLEQMENAMMIEFKKSLEPILNENATPFEITTEIFRCIKENKELCSIILGQYGDKKFATAILNIGKEHCIQSYAQFFENVSIKKIELYYTFVSAGCVALLEKWLIGELDMSVEEISKTADDIMMKGIAFLTK